MFGEEVAKFGCGDSASRGKDNRRSNLFTEFVVRYRKSYRLLNLGMSEKYCVDLQRRDLFASPVDLFL